MGKKMAPAQPNYEVGAEVTYTDRQGRRQHGKVYHVEAKWSNWGHSGDNAGKPAYISYSLQHPTYRNGQFHTSEDVIIGYTSVVGP